MQVVLIIDVAERDAKRFLEYERRVQPVLAEYGRLRNRLVSSFGIAEDGRDPRRVRHIHDGRRTEVHLVEFPDEAALVRFRADPRRVEAQQLLVDLDLHQRALVLKDV